MFMPSLPTSQPADSYLFTPFQSVIDNITELRDSLGNQWWLIDDNWLLVHGERYQACEREVEEKSQGESSPAQASYIEVGALTYAQVVFYTDGDMRKRVGYREIA
jgi:hypothetical protein